MDAADVIRDGVRNAGKMAGQPRHTLTEIAVCLEEDAKFMAEWQPVDAKRRLAFAASLRARHDHADPCDDESCPCYKAAMDNEHDQGRGPR